MKQKEFTEHTGKLLLLTVQRPYVKAIPIQEAVFAKRSQASLKAPILVKHFLISLCIINAFLYVNSICFVHIQFHLYIQPNDTSSPPQQNGLIFLFHKNWGVSRVVIASYCYTLSNIAQIFLH